MKFIFFILNFAWVLVLWSLSWKDYGTLASYLANLGITIAMAVLIRRIASVPMFWMVLAVFAQSLFLIISLPYAYLPIVDSPDWIKVASVLIILVMYFWFARLEKQEGDHRLEF